MDLITLRVWRYGLHLNWTETAPVRDTWDYAVPRKLLIDTCTLYELVEEVQLLARI